MKYITLLIFLLVMATRTNAQNLNGINVYSYDESMLEKAIALASSLKVPTIRYAIISWPHPTNQRYDLWNAAIDIPEYISPYVLVAHHASRLLRVKSLCKASNVKIVVDLHSWPGRLSADLQKSLNFAREFWAQMAFELDGQEHIAAFDIGNEPLFSYDNNRIFAHELMTAIRSYDSDRLMIYETQRGEIPTDRFLREQTSFYFRYETIKSAHFYWKNSFSLAMRGNYPTQKFNRGEIKKRIAHVRRYARKNRFYWGEIGMYLNERETYQQWKNRGALKWITEALSELSKAGAVAFHDVQNLLPIEGDSLSTSQKKYKLRQVVARYLGAK